MNKNHFFTIITASFNNESTIKQTLESIKNQTLQDLEHIVLDGGSQDGTLDILKDFERTYNLYWTSKPDKGISSALNKGLELAKGKYVLVLHADDRLLSPDILGYVFNRVRSQKHDIYSFPVIKEYTDDSFFLYKPIRMLWWHHFKTILPHQGSFVHQRVYQLVGGYRKHLSITMDYDFFYRALQSKCSIKFEDKPIALMGGTGISSSDAALKKRLREEIEVQKVNEKNPLWRLAQIYFWMLYFPYKIVLFKKFRKTFIKRKKTSDLIIKE
jgi:glycosyltransferase involved in cell wall biosynthesis